MLVTQVIESVIVVVAFAALVAVVIQRVVRSRTSQRLQTLVSQMPSSKFWWDSGLPVLELDASLITLAQATTIFRQAAKCKLPYLELSLRNANDQVLAEVGTLATLEKLRIASGSITDAGLAHLSELKKLEVLQLSNSQITNISLKVIANFTHLEDLALSRTAFDDTDLCLLLKLSKLQFLDLSQTSITDRGLEVLLQHGSLQHLDVTDTRCTTVFVENWRATHDQIIEVDL